MKKQKRAPAAVCFRLLGLLLLPWILFQCKTDNALFETITADDGSTWERVSEPGLGNDNNLSVVRMAEYHGYLYAITRNDAEGGELWRYNGAAWEQVSIVAGETNGIYGNPALNNLFAAMAVFQDKLYVGFSSGFQGGTLKSTGCEIWRLDGTTWEPVISDRKDTDETGTISGIEDCTKNDTATTAAITDAAKNWATDQWAGAVLQIASGSGRFRHFDILSNTSNTLTVQQNELSGETGTEYTLCDNPRYINPFPPYTYTLGTVQAGDTYEIGIGIDENGFGDYWNRAVNTMLVFDNRLYVSTGLNYEHGAQVWYTEDGETWNLTKPEHSFNLFHDDPTFPDGKKPVVVTALSLCPSTVSGTPLLYAGGTGSTGSAGRCARIAKLTESGWELIVDANVDENDTGTNENGFGDGMDCTMFDGNFMPWSLAHFKDMLFVGINSLGGARVLYTPNGSAEDGSWFYSAGGDSQYPNGFDGKMHGTLSLILGYKIYKNIVANIFAADDFLYAGLISAYIPPLGGTRFSLNGADIWKSPDGVTWEPITTNGFGDKYTISFEAFTMFQQTLYVSGSKGANSVVGGLGGAKIFRRVR